MIDRTLPLRQQQAAFTRDRLLGAGRQIFSASGYLSATVDEIARAAGASRATFYLHFKGGKRELAAALLDDCLPRARSRFRELDALLDEDSPLLRKQLYGWLADRLDALADSSNGSQALLQAAMLEPDLEAHLLRICEILVDSLDGYLANVPVPARTGARTRALLLEITTQRALALASTSRLPADNNSVLETLADMWFEAVAARPAPGALTAR
jgi:AcrR family transcriptional regulator